MGSQEFIYPLMSADFDDFCSSFLHQTVIDFPDGTLNDMFETRFDWHYSQFSLRARIQIKSFICPLIGVEPNNETIKNFLRMLIKKTVNPPQIRSDVAFNHLRVVRGEIRFANTAPPSYYDVSVCDQYLDVLISYFLRFVESCAPANMHLLVDMMTMDIVTFIISDIAYGHARRGFETECDEHFDTFAHARQIPFQAQELTLASSIRRFPSLIQSQMVEGIVIRCNPIHDFPTRIKIHLPASGDIYVPSHSFLFDVKKHARACTPRDSDGRILKKDNSGEFAWDRCQHLTGYLCPSALSNAQEFVIVRTPGHHGDVSTTPGYNYGTITRANAISPVLRDGLNQLISFFPRFDPIVSDFSEAVDSMLDNLNQPDFIDRCLDTIVEEACVWWDKRTNSETEMPQFDMMEADM